jgi:SagB-type dehydrogenase family enzyme
MLVTFLAAATVAIALSTAAGDAAMMPQEEVVVVSLPEPDREGSVPLEAALCERRSTREYGDAALTLSEVGQLLWAAQGITHGGARRTAPSAGALYPLEVYVAVGEVEGLESGLYRYRPDGHDLVVAGDEDLRAELASAASGQSQVAAAPAVIVIAAAIERTAAKYGQRAVRYAHMEAGAAAENIYLQAATLRLGTVFVGAFSDTRVKQVLALPDEESPLAIMPVGRVE